MTDSANAIQMFQPEKVNPGNTITHTGQVFLWVGFGGMCIPMFWMWLEILRQPDGKRYFHTLCFLINAIATLAYLVMANGYGNAYVMGADGTFRQFFFARYIDWSLTTPLQLLDLCGLGGASMDTTIWLLATDFLMIICGLIGGLIGTNNRWAWVFWGFGMLAFLPILYFLTYIMPTDSMSPSSQKVYSRVAQLTTISWSAYPLIWILAEGTGLISSDVEVIFYTLLDVTAKSIFGYLIITARDGVEGATRTVAQPQTPGTSVSYE